MFTTLCSAEWVLYSKNIDGDKFWYNSNAVKKINGHYYIHQKVRFNNDINGTYSAHIIEKINCKEMKYQTLFLVFYYDHNWTMKQDSFEGESEEEFIIEGSTAHALANVVCEKIHFLVYKY